MAKNKVVVISLIIAFICVLTLFGISCDVSDSNEPATTAAGATAISSPGTPVPATPGVTPGMSPTVSPDQNEVASPGATQPLEATATVIITPSPTHTPSPTATVSPTKTPTGTTSSNPDYAGKKIISLTFDDGPSGLLTPKLLDVLKSKNARATFFVVGDMIVKNYDKENYSSYTISTSAANVLKRAHDEGHQIANHTMSHYNLKKITLDVMRSEVNMLNDVVEEITGKRPTLLRPPYGSYNQEIRDNCGMTVVTWNIDSLDWAHISSKNIKNYAEEHNISNDEAKSILINELLFTGFVYDGEKHKSVTASLKHGAIILFHDIHPATADAVAILLDYLEANDYVVLPVTEMIMTEGPAPVAGQLYNSIRSR